jgi:hypothetical protein
MRSCRSNITLSGVVSLYLNGMLQNLPIVNRGLSNLQLCPCSTWAEDYYHSMVRISWMLLGFEDRQQRSHDSPQTKSHRWVVEGVQLGFLKKTCSGYAVCH